MANSARISFGSTSASALLGLVRFLAALLVCGEHWRNMLFVDYHQIGVHRLLYALPYVVTGAGHQAVVIFFVLSGYLISGSIFRLIQRGEWSWKLYLTHRLVRLWIVLIPALLLGAIFDLSGVNFHLAPDWYSDQPVTHLAADSNGQSSNGQQSGNHMSGGIAKSLNVHTLLGNLLFLQDILVAPFGSNSALWSLANEFWYYILFPCAFLALRKGTSTMSRLLNTLVFLLSSWLVGPHILLMFPIWLLGTVLALVPVPQTSVRIRWLAAALYCPVIFYLAKSRALPALYSDFALGIATWIFLWVLLGAKHEAPGSGWVRASRVGARFSYTLYLVHLPLVILLTALIQGESRWQPDPRHLLYALPVLLLAIGLAYGAASLTEFRTDHVREWIEVSLLGRTMRARDSVPVRAE
jgi:peptidoglycan/LPS O-acetylase OafA/YrhL